MQFKKSMARFVSAVALCGLMAIAGTTSGARAVTLLTIGATNPAAVVFTGTGAAAEINISVPEQTGFSLLDFFS